MEKLWRKGREIKMATWIQDEINPGKRGWEEFYRNRWQYDKTVRSTHGNNCTGGGRGGGERFLVPFRICSSYRGYSQQDKDCGLPLFIRASHWRSKVCSNDPGLFGVCKIC